MKGMQRVLAATIIGTLLATFSPGIIGATPAGELNVHFINVGQGDSILIDLAEIEVLIDGGKESASAIVVEYLNNYVDGPLEVMVATHPHADHIGGLIAVLDTFEVEEIWHNGDDRTEIYAEFKAAVDAEGGQVHVARQGDQISTGQLTFIVLNPATLGDDINNNSIVLSLSYGEVDFLFTGDAEKEAEASMVGAGVVPDVEILKVGHHGSDNASSESFLTAAQPEVAVYMAGENTYGHPAPETRNALLAIGAEIYGTDVNGTILVTTDGITYTVTVGIGVLEVETAIGEGQDLDGVVVLPVTITRVKDIITGETVPGVPIAYYIANLTFTPGFMEILEIRGGDPKFDTIPPENITIDNVAGTASVSDNVSPEGIEPPVVVFRIVVRLNGSALVRDSLLVNVIRVSDPPGRIMNAQDQPMVLTFQRGDIQEPVDGDIDIIDAMFGAQYVVGIRPAAEIRQLNMASVKHDDGGDIKDIVDCMFIAQYVVGIRDANFELIPRYRVQ